MQKQRQQPRSDSAGYGDRQSSHQQHPQHAQQEQLPPKQVQVQPSQQLQHGTTKEQLIAQLMAEANELRAKERDYRALQD